jgi:hypothetical protein
MISSVDNHVHLFYTSSMKLSQYAKQLGTKYRTTLRWFRTGHSKGYQPSSGTIVVTVHEELRMLSVVMTMSEEVGQGHPAFLERTIVNFIRHELTEYDESLEEVAGRIGVDEAMALIRQQVVALISCTSLNIPKSASGRCSHVMGRTDDAASRAACHQRG